MIEDFRNLFPELDAITDAVVNSSLVQAGHIETDPVRTLYAAAHIATGEGLYTVLSSTQGPVSVSFERTGDTATAKYWTTTDYGRKYLQILRSMKGAGVVAI